MPAPADIEYRINPKIDNPQIGALRRLAWGETKETNWQPILRRSLTYVGAYRGNELVGFVNVAWDGGAHAFLLDTTVHPGLQHQGVGTELVKRAAAQARNRGAHWLHVDFEPHLREFYAGCGFTSTEAGLLRLAP